MTWERAPLFKFEIIGVFVNTLTADDKFPVLDSVNLQFPIQMELSSKQKLFSEVFIPFVESSSNFLNIFKKVMIVIVNPFSKLQTVKDLVKPIFWKRCFRTSFNS